MIRAWTWLVDWIRVRAFAYRAARHCMRCKDCRLSLQFTDSLVFGCHVGRAMRP